MKPNVGETLAGQSRRDFLLKMALHKNLTQNPKLVVSKVEPSKIQNLIIPEDDFWLRRDTAQTHAFEFAPFGIPAKISANQADVLAAAQLSAGRFSRAGTPTTGKSASIKIVVRPGPEGALPDDLPQRLTHTGLEQWITVSAGEWGHAVANLKTREAVLFLSPALAADTRLTSRYFIDHYLLNFILSDWAMLHASCVASPDGQRLVVMIAPHNTGKSTTALHLLRAGYTFLADGMALLRYDESGFVVGGYPTGEVKLRDDVLQMFDGYSGPAVRVREQHKTVVDLRQTHPNRLAETLIRPASIYLCFVERSRTARTWLEPLPVAKALARLAGNTVYWDEPLQLQHNSDVLRKLIRIARLYYLKIGTDIPGIIATIDKLT